MPKIKKTYRLDQHAVNFVQDIKKQLEASISGATFSDAEVIQIAVRAYAEELGIEERKGDDSET